VDVDRTALVPARIDRRDRREAVGISVLVAPQEVVTLLAADVRILADGIAMSDVDQHALERDAGIAVDLRDDPIDLEGRTLDRLAGRDTCDLVSDVAQPIVSRVIGSFMGISEEDDAMWAKLMNSTLGAGDPDLNPDGVDSIVEKDIPEIFERCNVLIDARREHPTDDLTSVLVHAEVDGHKLEQHEIVMGFFLLMAAGNDSTKATYCSGMRASPRAARRLVKVAASR